MPAPECEVIPAMMHPSVIMLTDKQMGTEGRGLRRTKTLRPRIANGMQRFIRPYMGMFMPPSAESANTQLPA